jgi:hypothetical protein
LESIIDCFLELLPAPDVSFRRLHGRVTEKKLNLFEFASRAMAEPSTGTTKVMGREMVHADPLGILFYDCPNNIRRHSTTQFGPIFPDSPEYQTVSHSGTAKPIINQSLAPLRNGHCSQSSAFAKQVRDDPMAFPQLNLIQSQRHGFRSSQTASEQQPN